MSFILDSKYGHFELLKQKLNQSNQKSITAEDIEKLNKINIIGQLEKVHYVNLVEQYRGICEEHNVDGCCVKLQALSVTADDGIRITEYDVDKNNYKKYSSDAEIMCGQLIQYLGCEELFASKIQLAKDYARKSLDIQRKCRRDKIELTADEIKAIENNVIEYTSIYEYANYHYALMIEISKNVVDASMNAGMKVEQYNISNIIKKLPNFAIGSRNAKKKIELINSYKNIIEKH